MSVPLEDVITIFPLFAENLLAEFVSPAFTSWVNKSSAVTLMADSSLSAPRFCLLNAVLSSTPAIIIPVPPTLTSLPLSPTSPLARIRPFMLIGPSLPFSPSMSANESSVLCASIEYV